MRDFTTFGNFLGIDIDISAKSTSGEKGFLETIDQSINIMNQVALKKQLKMPNVTQPCLF